MARAYRLTFGRRLANSAIRLLHRLRLAPRHNYLLVVRGRISGRLHRIPVQLVEEGGQRWLVAPYGSVNWVRNVRAAGAGILSRNGRSESVRFVAVPGQESAPILKTYVNEVPITRPYFEAQPDAPVGAFLAEASQHPVFHVVPAPAGEDFPA
jgi:hypothetical protein